MTAYRVRYEGPQELALGVATALADAPGINLTSSAQPERRPGGVLLELVVEGDADAVLDAVSAARGGLPSEARLDLHGDRS